MISVNRFYNLALLLPLIVPALVMTGALVVGLPTFGPLTTLVSALIGSGMVGALPYSLFALWAIRRIRGKDEREIRRLAIRAPLLMTMVFIPFAFLASALEGNDPFDAFFILLYGIPCILILGYGYVGLAFWLRRLAGNHNWVAVSPTGAV